MIGDEGARVEGSVRGDQHHRFRAAQNDAPREFRHGVDRPCTWATASPPTSGTMIGGCGAIPLKTMELSFPTVTPSTGVSGDITMGICRG